MIPDRNPAPIRFQHSDPAERPFIVIWEVTRACDLACRHCRADAVSDRDPAELSREEALSLMKEVASFGTPPPLFVMTGGDPFKRPDLFDLIRQASGLGLAVAVSPSGTPSLTRANLERLRNSGAKAVSLSLDGPTREIHDGFRGVQGTYDWTIAGWRSAREAGLRVQVNTTVTPHNVEDLPEILRTVRDLGAMTWSVFFLVPTGRGKTLPQLSPPEFEDVLNFLYDANKIVSTKSTEAHHFRRVAVQRRILEEEGAPPEETLGLGALYSRLCARAAELGLVGEGPVRRPPLNIGAGRGFVFISHTGVVQASGFLPLAAGNVRRRSLVEIYRESPLFAALRDETRLKGRCSRCEFGRVCGGSRSRAFGATGDPLQEEPWCVYEPGSFGRRQRIEELIGTAR